MNNVYANMFNNIKGRIFGEFEALNTDIHPDIIKTVKVVRDKTLDGKMFKFKLSTGIDVYIIRELDSFIFMDILLVDDKRSVVCSIPYDLYNYEQKTILDIVKGLYSILCCQLVSGSGDTTYNKIISLAPTVLSLHTLRHVCDELFIADFIDEDDKNFAKILENAMYDSLSYSVNDLLDYCGISAIIDENIKKGAGFDESN